MEIGSFSSATVATPTTVQTERTQETRQVEQQEVVKQQAAEQEKPRPVTNAEGQTTGTVINVTA